MKYRIAMFTLLALPVAMAMAAPMGYSVNSDAGQGGDHLHLIDLANGSSVAVGVGVTDQLPTPLIDIEGLAFAPDSSLWGVDDESSSLFQIDTGLGTVKSGSRRTIFGLDAFSKNDFSLTFTCDGSLYATSVVSRALYLLDPQGNASRVGEIGSLKANISAIAAYGDDPVRLYGLGNGLLAEQGQRDNRSLYEINLEDGTATPIGNIGPAAADYHQAGLSFDENGQLFAITDRSALSNDGEPSEILSINIDTGKATVIAKTSVVGFESLAIAPPGGCDSDRGKHEDATPIPSLDIGGKLLAILTLMFAGLAILRQRVY